MQPGDIVFSVAQGTDPLSTSVPRAFIRAGQYVKAKAFAEASPNVPVVHAAIAIDENRVIESVGSGIQVTDLSTETPPRVAIVFSCDDALLAEGAATAAAQFNRDVVGTDIKGSYSVWKAFLSLFRRSSYSPGLQARINESVSIGNSSFCSQFVANAYEVGNLYTDANLVPPPPPVFDIRPTATTPWDLASFCDGDGKFFFAGFWQDSAEVRL
ncbi:hypothetical protein ACW9IB_11415 [Pseudomonas sp. SDO524_S393]